MMKDIVNNQKLHLVLKNGRVYHGKVLDHDDKTLLFLDKFGKRVTIDLSMISERTELD